MNIMLLDLTLGKLNNKTGPELEHIFSNIPNQVTALDVSWNFFYLRSYKELKKAFKAIAVNVNVLILSWNNFFVQSGADLAKIFTVLPSHINTLSINSFCEKPGDEFAQVLASIPESVISLNLDKNQLYKFSEKDLGKLKGSLPYIKTIELSYDEVQAMSILQRKLVKGIFPNIENIILLDTKGNEIKNSNSLLISRYIWELGGREKPPSLLNWATFYMAENPTELQNAPSGLCEQIQLATVPKNFFS